MRIFISYSRHDIKRVEPIVNELMAQGHETFLDSCYVTSEDFAQVILQHLKEADCILFFHSSYANNSQWVIREINFAFEIGKRVLPVKLDNEDYSPAFCQKLYSRVSVQWEEEHHNKCIEKLKGLLIPPPEPKGKCNTNQKKPCDKKYVRFIILSIVLLFVLWVSGGILFYTASEPNDAPDSTGVVDSKDIDKRQDLNIDTATTTIHDGARGDADIFTDTPDNNTQVDNEAHEDNAVPTILYTVIAIAIIECLIAIPIYSTYRKRKRTEEKLKSKNTLTKINIFIAGSLKLDRERDALRAVISIMHNHWRRSHDLNIFSYTYEDFSNRFTTNGGPQQKYEDFIKKDADWAIFVIDGNVGGITLNEFNVAVKAHSSNGSPNILVFSNGKAQETEETTKIKNRISDIKQYWIEYNSVQQMKKEFESTLNWDLIANMHAYS